jgi:hypothetical protein
MFFLPRCFTQSMIIATFPFLFSCSNNSQNNNQLLKVVNEGMERTKRSATHSNETILYSLVDKLSDFRFKPKAEKWEPKARLINQYSMIMERYIENLKSQLLHPENEQGVEEFFEKKGNGAALYDNIKKYKENLLNTDSLIWKEFHNTLIVIAPEYDTTEKGGRYFIDHFFEGRSVMESVVLLSQIENNIKAIENKVLVFCDVQVPNYWDGFFSYSPLISQSSSYVRGGEIIELIAGIGSFGRQFQTKITMNGRTIQLSEDAAAHYIFHSSRKPGKHIIPLKIEYTDEFQKKQILEKNIEYTVAKE